ncbi:phosphonoacetate hydrolase [Rhodoplanes sp. TEM]|uniref:Phosphonoacetate hydrolase n=1 Tax=Rhodoplanes tepidamans TaxID=200616 RepID=A0ABT5JC02_RHOTP|nr:MULTISPECIES: phosphonoacetate hydrolase [Rhodoplanes]MDC7786575.1 phosphonoacetate hydrolase [Rhodoplanes tepidamans]MDC7983087.1 phosphonoacetate hydrolase [Rhodoplanes sp. TEM]MDQ0357544.1 phosphonoacetate hydrolase [Rhodoplanes tepidamans]
MPPAAACPSAPPDAVEVNGRVYAWPRRPTVVVCFDGCDPAYVDAARDAGAIPTMVRMAQDGFYGIADAAMPTFTNPNNVSIVCGAPPAVHGVSGNYYLDRASGREIMMLDASLLRAPTVLARFSQAGAAVAAVTAKDKLRKALGHELDGIAVSAEKADAATLAEHGIADLTALVGRATPDQYSADLSLYVLDAGIRLLETRRPDLLYLSLSDYVQHKHAPGTPDANAFMADVDSRFARLIDLGATLGVVADHGMTDMARPDGTPAVLYLGDHLDAAFGHDATRVICPITDPFVRHHGALGGFVRVHLMRDDLDAATVAAFVRALPGVEHALDRDEACARFELPLDREADIVIVAARGTAIGARAADHDLSQLAGERLRSHGSIAEQRVPFLLSHSLVPAYETRAELGLRNFDIFDYALNGVA